MTQNALDLPYPEKAGTLERMSGRRRPYASSLVLVAFASICLSVCTTLAASGDKLACCPDLGDGRASFSSCCATGDQSQSSELPPTVHATVPGMEVAYIATPQTPISHPTSAPAARHSSFGSADPQALLSTFLI